MSAYAWYPEIEADVEADEHDAQEFAMEAYESRMLDHKAGRCSRWAAEYGGAEYNEQMLEFAMCALQEAQAPQAPATIGTLSEVAARRAA